MDGAEHSVEKWDLIIAHPPCTYLSNAGAVRLYHGTEIVTFQSTDFRLMNESRIKDGIKARDFFLECLNSNAAHIAVENPIPTRLWCMPEYTQVIQPYEHGHPYKKKTCLWLKNLPLLQPTKVIKPEKVWVSGGVHNRTTGKHAHGFRDAKNRSKTFEGIAKAMAQQWGDYLLGKTDRQLTFFEEE